jgi:hypothetical protein
MPMCKYVGPWWFAFVLSEHKSISTDNIYGGTCENKIALLLSSEQQKLQVTLRRTWIALNTAKKTVSNKQMVGNVRTTYNVVLDCTG